MRLFLAREMSLKRPGFPAIAKMVCCIFGVTFFIVMGLIGLMGLMSLIGLIGLMGFVAAGL